MSIEATMSGLGPEAVFQKRAGEKILVARRARATQPPGAVEDGELLWSLPSQDAPRS